MPSATSPSQVSTVTSGLRKNFRAESLTRAQCRSISGVTPSNARAPSNTDEPSHAACVRGPMIGTLPSCQSPWKNVQVLVGALRPSLPAIDALLLFPAIFFAPDHGICHDHGDDDLMESIS